MPDIALFRTAPRAPSTDFTPEDPLAFDYLGQQIGNWLWPGFTSRTSRAGYYPFVTYGLRLCDELATREGLGRDDVTIRALFERWERLWALAVCAYHGGQVPQEHTMRGLRGALRYYRAQPSDKYTLDFPLLSRQLELGGLGAYLTSLREHGLVARDRLRPTPLGAKLADWMWDDPGSRVEHIETYIRVALSPDQGSVPGKVGNVTIRAIGERGGLGRILVRTKLQELLWHRLFEDHPPPKNLAHLGAMAACLARANQEDVCEAEPFLRGIVEGRWGAVAPDLQLLVSFAIAFGDLSAALRAAFDLAYKFIQLSGFTASFSRVATECFAPDLLDRLNRRRAVWLKQDRFLPRMGQLASHGSSFVRTVRTMDISTPAAALETLLTYHRRVQKDRGHDGGWLRREADVVVLERGGYTSWSDDPDRWVVGYKTAAMRQLLADLGRLS